PARYRGQVGSFFHAKAPGAFVEYSLADALIRCSRMQSSRFDHEEQIQNPQFILHQRRRLAWSSNCPRLVGILLASRSENLPTEAIAALFLDHSYKSNFRLL